MRFLFFLAGAALLLSSGCASPRLVGRSDLTVVSNSQLPPPTTGDLITPDRSYVIGPLDQVAVDVFGVPDLSRAVRVDASGRIALPLLGSMQVSGKTTTELADMIGAGLRGRYVRDPHVTVNLTETVSQVVTVDGAVKTPGIYPITGRMTLMRAVARAEGVTEFARASHVVVFRRVSNQEMAAVYDLRAIRQGIYADPEIFANDVVLVGDSQAKRVFRDVLQASGFLVSPLVAILNR